MTKFRKRPVVINAIKWTGENREEILTFNTGTREIDFLMDMSAVIHTLEGDMKADMGDWIIKGIKGELYPCKPDMLEATYEPVMQ
jgi:hypothetical protein